MIRSSANTGKTSLGLPFGLRFSAQSIILNRVKDDARGGEAHILKNGERGQPQPGSRDKSRPRSANGGFLRLDFQVALATSIPPM